MFFIQKKHQIVSTWITKCRVLHFFDLQSLFHYQMGKANQSSTMLKNQIFFVVTFSLIKHI